MYLHTSNWAGYFAFPVELISKGRQYARVRLRHKTRIGRVDYPAGTIKSRVPLWALSESPSQVAYVSRGGGRFTPELDRKPVPKAEKERGER